MHILCQKYSGLQLKTSKYRKKTLVIFVERTSSLKRIGKHTKKAIVKDKIGYFSANQINSVTSLTKLIYTLKKRKKNPI
jgi:hypothetical protein